MRLQKQPHLEKQSLSIKILRHSPDAIFEFLAFCLLHSTGTLSKRAGMRTGIKFTLFAAPERKYTTPVYSHLLGNAFKCRTTVKRSNSLDLTWCVRLLLAFRICTCSPEARTPRAPWLGQLVRIPQGFFRPMSLFTSQNSCIGHSVTPDPFNPLESPVWLG